MADSKQSGWVRVDLNSQVQGGASSLSQGLPSGTSTFLHVGALVVGVGMGCFSPLSSHLVYHLVHISSVRVNGPDGRGHHRSALGSSVVYVSLVLFVIKSYTNSQPSSPRGFSPISLQPLLPLTHIVSTGPTREPPPAHFPFIHICESPEG